MTVKLDIAWFSPLPPKATGIAGYSERLLQALAATGRVDLTLYDEQISECPLSSTFDCNELSAVQLSPEARAKIGIPVYQLGNNARYHGAIWRLAQRLPGVVILHDAVLYNMMAGMGRGRLLQALAANGFPAADTLQQLEACITTTAQPVADTILQHYPSPHQFPLLNELNHCARVVVVHNQTAASLLQQQGYRGPIEVMPHLSFGDCKYQPESIEHPVLQQLVQECQQNPALKVVGLFGFRGDNKQADTLVEALQQLPCELRQQTRLLIVGQGHTSRWLAASPFAANTLCVDYVTDNDFQQALHLTDLLVNLRYPSFGETSGVQIQAMTAGCATLVNRTGWFAELPGSVTCHLPAAPVTVEALVPVLTQLLADDQRRRMLGSCARDWMEQHHNADNVATQLVDILSRAQLFNPPQRVPTQPGAWVRCYRRKRLAALMMTDGQFDVPVSTPASAPSINSLKTRLQGLPAVVWLYRLLIRLPLIKRVVMKVLHLLR